MANSTFSGPVRSENGFKNIVKSSTTGALTSEMTLSVYTATVTVANGATTGKESSIGIPSNFIPMAVTIAVTGAASNSVTLNDIGTDADTDGFVDGISAAVNSTGFKGYFPCNGVLGMSGGTTTAATETADEVEVVLSGDPGADTTVVLKFMGISSSSDAS
jgi:enolase